MKSALAWFPAVLVVVPQVAVLVTFLGAGMAGVVAWTLLLTLVPLAGVLGLLGGGAVLAWKRRLVTPALALVFVAAPTLWPLAMNFGVGQVAFPAKLADTTPTATVRAPFDEPVRVFWGGDDGAKNHHVFMPDQRWAYDLIIEPGGTGSARLEDYGCYGKTVLAPAAGRVHVAHDGEPDVTPSQDASNLMKPLGNHVALELDTHTFLVLAHLQKGSLRVKAGDTVTEGQPLGACGNSGNTSEPHLHLHHQRQDPAHFPVGFAEGLPLFFRGHGGPAMPEGGFEELDDGGIRLTGAVLQHQAP